MKKNIIITLMTASSIVLAQTESELDINALLAPTDSNHIMHNLNKIKKLDLSNQKKIVGSFDFSVLENLEELNLRNTGLDILPKEILKLKKLKRIDLSNNLFYQFPSELLSIYSLEEIYFNNETNVIFNERLDINDETGHLKILTLDSIDLQALNQLNIIAPSLEFLSLKNDHLSKLPSGLSKLSNIKVLDLSNNDIIEVPKEFQNLDNLEKLYLYNNKKFNLDKAYSTFSNMNSLSDVYITENNIDLEQPIYFNKTIRVHSKKEIVTFSNSIYNLVVAPNPNHSVYSNQMYFMEGFGIRFAW